MAEKYDVAVIGGGPAGYVSAIKAAMLGGSVVLFEKDTVGGTCLNRGCIPTKSYIRTAEMIEDMTSAAARGILATPAVGVDMQKVADTKNGVVKKLTGGVAALLRAHGVTVVTGEAHMEDRTTIVCDEKRYQASSTLLCGGSVPGTLSIPGADLPGVLSSDTILELTNVPASLCVIGGGVIGCELATAFAAFGSEVTIVEYASTLIPMMDGELCAAAEQSLRKKGMHILTSTAVSAIRKEKNKFVVQAGSEEITCERVLISVGRKPDLSCLGNLCEEIKTEKGYVVADQNMRTSIPNIYAPGDINGKCMLAHAAFVMGETAAKNAMGAQEVCRLDRIASCLYTLPEIATVGMSQEQAKKRYGSQNIAVGRFPFSANGRALAGGHGEGFVKVIIEKRYGELLGAHMVGACATELIAQPAALMASEATAFEIAEMAFPHPTMSEAFMEACADALSACIHLPPGKMGR